MNIPFTHNAWEEFSYRMGTDETVADRIRDLIIEIRQNILKGTGKPEPLKPVLQGFWSRRPTGEHRLV